MQSVPEPFTLPDDQSQSVRGSRHEHSSVCCGNVGAVPKAHTAELPSVKAMLPQQHLRWAGQCSRMDDTRMPKAVIYGELSKGKHDRGAPRQHYKDQLK